MIEKSDVLRKRDLMLDSMLHYIAKNPELNKELVLHGGGALHFIYSSSRYSNDLDFLCPQYSKIREILTTNLCKDIPANNVLLFSTLKADRNNFFRTSYTFGNIDDSNDITSRIEIKHQDVNDHMETGGKYNPLLVETPNELYADKIIACIERMKNRQSLKGADLFDLFYLKDVLNALATNEQVAKKAMDRGLMGNGFDTRTLDNILKFIVKDKNQKQIIEQIRKTMLPEVFQTQRFDRNFFEHCIQLFDKVYGILK